MKLRAGFIPLVDAAVLIAAADRGFAADEGIDLELVREVSWSNVRDKLNLGHLEAAHVLASLAIAGALGLDYSQVPLSAALVLSFNGNSIVLNTEMHAEFQRVVAGDLHDPVASGAALREVVARRAARGAEPLTFGITFPFSNHNYLLRYWMAAAGVNPDEDVRLVVSPPSHMVEDLREARVHGFCAGAPWPAAAVDAGVGRILHRGTDILGNCPEKVLALRSGWAQDNPEPTSALLRALIRAAAWCASSFNRNELARLLADPARLNTSPEIITRGLDGRLRTRGPGMTRGDARFLVLGASITRPAAQHGLWLYSQMVRWGQVPFSDEAAQRVRTCFAPLLHDAALESMLRQPPVPNGVQAFDGRMFDPEDLKGYLNEMTAQSAGMPTK